MCSMDTMYIVYDGDTGVIISIVSSVNPFSICDQIETLGVTVDKCSRKGNRASIVTSNVSKDQLDRIIEYFRNKFTLVVDGKHI